ncbi:hypothetical protein [Pygmaiobacter massiliensis]|uniref:hypothetical protein n=1 Tax=Pygmaiobacter massiliensis TaxID=1917873 RepID=UPI002A7F744D|nr:hypothetical protein [Pygmaiobacter massiliensis]MDY4784830.1 hypothetical protein [Pygmaiobacter massiliensis]
MKNLKQSLMEVASTGVKKMIKSEQAWPPVCPLVLYQPKRPVALRNYEKNATGKQSNH